MKNAPALFVSVMAFVSCVVHAGNPAKEMAAAANQFLESLGPEQRATAVFDLNHEERFNWHFVPKPRKGLSFKEMNQDQRKFANGLLESALSHRGLIKVTTIMSLESVLFDLENQSPRRNPELYFFTIFGKPGGTNHWGWRVEGHHLSINLTIADGEISTTPSFFGSNPGEVESGPKKGVRPLASEEDLARQLAQMLSGKQKNVAIFSTQAPRDILTGNSRRIKALEPAGLSYSEMTKGQREALMKIVEEYLSRNRPEIMKSDLAKITKAGLSKLTFGWAGGLERGQPHYYRIQGPTFLLEYDNTQNGANHVHTVWRDFENDFGEDILQKHYEQTLHQPQTK